MVKTLILGLGNTIMSDDGFGPNVIASLKDMHLLPEAVELMDGGTLGLDLLPYLEGVRRLIIVDAVEQNKSPGTVIQLLGDDVPIALETKLSPHQMGMKDLLAVARLMGHLPEEIQLVGVQPELLEMGTELTQAVSAAIPEVHKRILEIIHRSADDDI